MKAKKKPRANKNGQYAFFKRQASDHGGILRRKRNGRGARPLAVKRSMHLVLRSTQATGEMSFRKSRNEKRITAIIKKFSEKYSVQIKTFANAGNHLHIQLQLGARQSYKPFIRAITGAIAQIITQASRTKKLAKRFWHERPFTRIMQGFKDSKGVSDYIRVNQIEGFGVTREVARAILEMSG